MSAKKHDEPVVVDKQQEEADRQTHLIDPLTHPSSGDPPPAVTPQGERLGAVPMTRNAAADMEQARQEGLKAAESGDDTKAEKASDKKQEETPAQKAAATKQATARREAKAEKDEKSAADDTAKPNSGNEPVAQSSGWSMPFGKPADKT